MQTRLVRLGTQLQRTKIVVAIHNQMAIHKIRPTIVMQDYRQKVVPGGSDHSAIKKPATEVDLEAVQGNHLEAQFEFARNVVRH